MLNLCPAGLRSLALSVLFALPALAAPEPPKLRLPDAAVPAHYGVELTIRPSEEAFQGVIDIDLDVKKPLDVLWLNGAGIKVEAAELSAGGKKIAATPVDGGAEFVGFTFAEPVAVGKARLHVTYTGTLALKETAGLFKQKEGDDWYVFSQFEATDARRAFPCFDEPGYKVPWQITLKVPKDLVAVSNTPSVKESAAGDLKTVTFAETKPLPSYLIALGVGPFEFVDAGSAGAKKTKIRIIVPKGRAKDARWAALSTGPILAELERYFGIPYPYEKLDNLAIPQTVGFGAMENPGLITYVSTLMLSKPEDESVGFTRAYASVAAHEMAHQWFGDLVTMKWWDDTWLNESFASWMGDKTIERWKPEWDWGANKVRGRSEAMGADSLVTARKIHQAIESKNDIANAFDGITYGKGEAVLNMFESYMGEEKFQKGVQRYLKTHAFGNATAEDFLAALSTEGGPAIAPSFSTFLDQPGVPLLTAKLVCEKGATPKLVFSQKRFLPKGSTGSSKQTWQVPVCARWASGKETAQACTMLMGETGELALRGAATCPDWVLANAGEKGYYRVLYQDDMLGRLFAGGGKSLALGERVGLLGDAAALAETGDLPAAKALALVPVFAGDPNRHIVSSTVQIAESVKDDLVPEELRPNYAHFIQETFGARARAAGFTSKPGESDDEKLIRSNLVRLVAIDGEDPVLAAEAVKLARAWLADRRAVEPEMVRAVVFSAAWNGDKDLFDRFVAEAKKTKERRDRQVLLQGLGAFRDPAILDRAMKIAIGDDFDVREAMGILRSASRNPEAREKTWAFVKSNFDVLVAKLPRDTPAYLPFLAGGFCDEKHRADLEAFFGDKAPKFNGGPRNLAQALEGISLCAAFKSAQEASVAEFLRGFPATKKLDVVPAGM